MWKALQILYTHIAHSALGLHRVDNPLKAQIRKVSGVRPERISTKTVTLSHWVSLRSAVFSLNPGGQAEGLSGRTNDRTVSPLSPRYLSLPLALRVFTQP